jgi:hypothetical protein
VYRIPLFSSFFHPFFHPSLDVQYTSLFTSAVILFFNQAVRFLTHLH